MSIQLRIGLDRLNQPEFDLRIRISRASISQAQHPFHPHHAHAASLRHDQGGIAKSAKTAYFIQYPKLTNDAVSQKCRFSAACGCARQHGFCRRRLEPRKFRKRASHDAEKGFRSLPEGSSNRFIPYALLGDPASALPRQLINSFPPMGSYPIEFQTNYGSLSPV